VDSHQNSPPPLLFLMDEFSTRVTKAWLLHQLCMQTNKTKFSLIINRFTWFNRLNWSYTLFIMFNDSHYKRSKYNTMYEVYGNKLCDNRGTGMNKKGINAWDYFHSIFEMFAIFYQIMVVIVLWNINCWGVKVSCFTVIYYIYRKLWKTPWADSSILAKKSPMDTFSPKIEASAHSEHNPSHNHVKTPMKKNNFSYFPPLIRNSTHKSP